MFFGKSKGEVCHHCLHITAGPPPIMTSHYLKAPLDLSSCLGFQRIFNSFNLLCFKETMCLCGLGFFKEGCLSLLIRLHLAFNFVNVERVTWLPSRNNGCCRWKPNNPSKGIFVHLGGAPLQCMKWALFGVKWYFTWKMTFFGFWFLWLILLAAYLHNSPYYFSK